MSSGSLSRRLAYVLVLVPVAAFTAWMELGLRASWVKQLGAKSVIAGSAPDAVAVVFTALLFAVVRQDAGATPLKLTAMSVLVMGVYEIAQFWIPGRTFDPYDLIAAAIGGVIALPLLTIPYHLTRAAGDVG